MRTRPHRLMPFLCKVANTEYCSRDHNEKDYKYYLEIYFGSSKKILYNHTNEWYYILVVSITA